MESNPGPESLKQRQGYMISDRQGLTGHGCVSYRQANFRGSGFPIKEGHEAGLLNLSLSYYRILNPH